MWLIQIKTTQFIPYAGCLGEGPLVFTLTEDRERAFEKTKVKEDGETAFERLQVTYKILLNYIFQIFRMIVNK